VNLLDVVLALALVSALVGGYRIGLIARVASWIGALGGFLLALRALPYVLQRVPDDLAPAAELFLTLGVLLIGAALGGAVGEMIGSTLRRAVPPPARILDRSGGAVAGVVGVLVGLWLFLPIVAQVPGAAAQQARGSWILNTIDEVAPRPPDASQAVKNLVGDGRIPDVFDDLRPAPEVGPPPSEVPVPAEVVARAVASTSNIEADGCGGRHEGSGFAVADDLVATNAHVVAGADRIRARLPNGKLLRATIVAFDERRDLALLSVPGLGQRPLAIGEAKEGEGGAVLGYPGGQDTVRVAPAIIRNEAPTIGRDIYGRSRTERQVLYLASQLQPGDSGSALINPRGQVVGVAFAIAPDRPGTSYAVDDSELRAMLAVPRAPGAGGPCI
jgi:S1-C subfamily serine protease